MGTDAEKSTPTKDLKRRKVVRRIMENKGKTNSVSRAMREEGYSDNYARNPQTFLRTNASQKLLDKYFPEDKLHKKTQELMEGGNIRSMVFSAERVGNKTTHIADKVIKMVIEKKGGFKMLHIIPTNHPPKKTVYFLVPERRIQKEAAEMAYKLRGSFAPEKHQLLPSSAFEDMSDEDLAAAIKEAKDFLTKKK